VFDGALRGVLLLHPAIVSGSLEAGGFLGFFCAFGGLLGVLRALFAHGISFFLIWASGPPFFIAARILA
jgi:hypothetical protein